MWKCDKTQIVMNLRRNWLWGLGVGGHSSVLQSPLTAPSLQTPRNEERIGFPPLCSEPLVSAFQIKPQAYLLQEIPNYALRARVEDIYAPLPF